MNASEKGAWMMLAVAFFLTWAGKPEAAPMLVIAAVMYFIRSDLEKLTDAVRDLQRKENKS